MIVRRSPRWLCWLCMMLLVTLAGFPQLLVAWRDNPDSFQDLNGSWAIRPDDTQRLAGNYTSGSTTGNFVTSKDMKSVYFEGASLSISK